MGTIVSFHAHPDDESIATGGLLARAADAGHRVVLVFATRGELGEPVPGVLADGEQLSLRRTAECHASAEVLGVDKVVFLGWTDSGMIGEPTNDAPWCFWQADVDEAAARLALLLQVEGAEVLTTYDDHGGYGHPDHIQVHRVGARAAALAGTPIVAQATMNRDLMIEAWARAAEFGVDLGTSAEGDAAAETPGPEATTMGTPAAEITHAVDVTSVLDRKIGSMRAHASQIGPDHFMVAMPTEAFAFVFGTEHFIVGEVPDPAPAVFSDLFAPFG